MHPDHLDADIAVPPGRVSVLRDCKAAAQEARGGPLRCGGGTAGQRGGCRSRCEGRRTEREIINEHRAVDVHAERYPLSGASRFRGALTKVCQP